ncbi:MAG: hydrolase, partial [Streptococcus sp.]|nr:hydrolase [Streptococcus sp.]
MIDIPIIYTVLSDQIDLTSRIEAGVDILNISCGAETARVVKKIRQLYPDFPIIATGGPSEESILSVIQAGANAVTYTAPTSSELFKEKMKTYRNEKN